MDLVAQFLDVAKFIQIGFAALEESTVFAEERRNVLLEIVDFIIPLRLGRRSFVPLRFFLFNQWDAAPVLCR